MALLCCRYWLSIFNVSITVAAVRPSLVTDGSLQQDNQGAGRRRAATELVKLQGSEEEKKKKEVKRVRGDRE